MKKVLFSGIKYELQALNQEKLLLKLSTGKKVFFVNRITHTQLQIFLKQKYEKQFEQQIKMHGATILKKKFVGFALYKKKFLLRVGAVIGIIFCFFAMLSLQSFVFKTEVNGLENLKKQEIFSVLKQNKLNGFLAKKSLNLKQIESIIGENFNNVGFVSAMVKGSTIIINIKEKISAGDYDNVSELKPLFAKQSGIISSINLISGTLKVKVGDLVKIGDVLVEPFIIDGSGSKRKVRADAEIVARVWHVGKELFSTTRLEVKRTGKAVKHNLISFLGINLTKPLLHPPFTSYETITTTACLSKNTILPILQTTTIFYETKTVEIKQDFESVKQNILEKARQKALQMLDECEIINKQYHTITENFSIVVVEYVIETEKQIS